MNPSDATAAQPTIRALKPAVTPGTLYLIPTPLGEGTGLSRLLPADVIELAAGLGYFVAENARTARAFLKQLPLTHALQAIEIRELSEHTAESDLPELLQPLLDGRDAGLVSEAGCPAVADPGGTLVAMAHRHGIRVVPLVGPNSMLLALMASGLNGQRFAFTGYLPVAPAERDTMLRDLERRSASGNETMLMIETPYRAQAVFDAMTQVLGPETRLCVASELTLPGQLVRTLPISAWRVSGLQLGKVPVVFAWLAAPTRGPRPQGGERAGQRPATPSGRSGPRGKPPGARPPRR